ncbi:class I SAM-dependent methyltransferase [Streptomyces inhibens]|uniref:class I SAM-dependent methyltransferase n=1 Tax=Streptomyces inhibens TaxID=2293571 RepID=UPI00369FAD79
MSAPGPWRAQTRRRKQQTATRAGHSRYGDQLHRPTESEEHRAPRSPHPGRVLGHLQIPPRRRRAARPGDRRVRVDAIPRSRPRSRDPLGRPARALDLGQAEGKEAVFLARQGCEVTGVDLSAAQVARATNWWRSEPRLRFVHADACDFLTADTQPFYTLYSVWGAVRFTDPEQLLPLVAKRLTPRRHVRLQPGRADSRRIRPAAHARQMTRRQSTRTDRPALAVGSTPRRPGPTSSNATALPTLTPAFCPPLKPGSSAHSWSRRVALVGEGTREFTQGTGPLRTADGQQSQPRTVAVVGQVLGLSFSLVSVGGGDGAVGFRICQVLRCVPGLRC